VISALDLVITVDTAIAHLTGAMRKPVWTLLSHPPDWRWGMQGASTTLYPTMRLFRQSRPQDWNSVLEEVERRLRACVRGSTALPEPLAC
jgi:ADP-heptose:LPS heptosyltransferase